MDELISEYIKVKKSLFDSFNCTEDYFIKNLKQLKWIISSVDDWYIVSYWEKKSDKEIKTDVVIVKKNGEPQVFETKEYTMIIGIQCVKIAFIFYNCNRIC